MLGVLAGLWPSALVPLASGTHTRVVIDSPAGEIAFTLRREAARRMWHVPESTQRPHDQEAARLREERLVQLAAGIAPPVSKPGTRNTVHISDRRRAGRDTAGH